MGKYGFVGAAGDQSVSVREAFRPVLEMLDEALLPFLNLLPVRVLRGQVMKLLGVFLQVEQVFGSVGGPPDVFHLSICEEMIRLILTVTWGMLAM